METYIAFLIGLFIGALCGIVCMSILIVGREADRR